MTLLVTIFLLVLLTEIIEWIGKPVLLQLVRFLTVASAISSRKPDTTHASTFYSSVVSKVLWPIYLPHLGLTETTTDFKTLYTGGPKTIGSNKFTGPVRQVGQTEEKS